MTDLFTCKARIIAAEEMIDAIDTVIKKYHEVLLSEDCTDQFKELVHLTAIEHIKALGFTGADAERWLKPGNKRVRR